MKLAAMEALYDGQEGAPLTAVGILRPEAQRTNDDDAFYFKIDIPKMLSLMSFRSADAFVPGINDLVYGNEKYGVMSAAEKIERGRVAVEELGRYRTARKKGDTAAIAEIEAKFDRSTPRGAEFLREHFAYFGYGYLDSPQQIVPDVPLLFYSFRVMVGAGCFFILLLGLVWWLNRRDRLGLETLAAVDGRVDRPAGLPRLAGRVGRRRGRTSAVGHPGPDARGRRRLENPQRIGLHDLLHLSGAVHGAAHRRVEHSVPANQNRP